MCCSQCVVAAQRVERAIMTIRPHPSEFLHTESGMDLPGRCAPILDAWLTGRGDPAGDIDRLLAEDPESVFGHCLRAAIIVRGDDSAARSRLSQSIATIETICPPVDHHVRRHASAARAWLDGDQTLAAERYGAIVVDFPRDIIALAAAHALDFRLGLRRMLRDRVAQVLPEWHREMPGYASVLGRGLNFLQPRNGPGWTPASRSTSPGIVHCSISTRTTRGPRSRSTTPRSPGPVAFRSSPTHQRCYGACSSEAFASATAGTDWPIAGTRKH